MVLAAAAMPVAAAGTAADWGRDCDNSQHAKGGEALGDRWKSLIAPAGALLAVHVAACGDVQQVVRLAHEEGISLGHSGCEPAHLLLGVLKEAGPAASILIRVGVPLAKARMAVKSSVRTKQEKQAFLDIGDDGNPKLPLSSEAERALKVARDVAEAAGEQCNGLHVLRGLLATQQAVTILKSLDADPEVVLVQFFNDAFVGHDPPPLTFPISGPNDTLEERASSKARQELTKQWEKFPKDVMFGSAAEFEEFIRTSGIEYIQQPSDQPTPLHLAAEAGDAIAVRTLLTAGGFDVNARGPGKATPLHFGIRGANLVVVQTLLGAGADVDAVDFLGDTALHWAGLYGRDSFVQPLLAAGSKIDAPNNYGTTPLGVAAECGNVGVIEALLKYGADIDGGNEGGRTPLSLAAMFGQASAVQTLLGAAANVNARGSDGTSPLRCAAQSGSVDCGKALLEAGADIQADYAVTCWTALHIAAAQGHTDFVKLLLAGGASKEATDTDGNTPLHAAAQNGHVETIKELLAAGSDIHARNEYGLTPLEWARRHDHIEAVEVLRSAAGKQQDLLPYASPMQLLQAFEKVSKPGPARSGTPGTTSSRSSSARPSGEGSVMEMMAMMRLQGSAKDGTWSGDTVRQLAQMGANVPLVNYDFGLINRGLSFLHTAAEQGKADVIRALVECGVNPSLTSGTALRVPAIHYACIKSDHADVIETLLELGASADERDTAGYTTLATAAEAGSLQCVKALLAHGADVTARDNDGLTVLMAACLCDPRQHNPHTKAAIVRLLLAAGADPTAESDINGASRDGTTALHLAAKSGFTNAVELLVTAGADLGAQDKNGNTPLHYAVMNSSVQAAAALVEAGAPLNVANASGRTALGEARRMGNGALVTLLQGHSSS
ncbi:hypothetical protein N2152v2_000671 [Parachlorella kessleri]